MPRWSDILPDASNMGLAVGNFVARLLPELDVRIIDVDLLFCKPHRNMSADTITRQYLTMKAAMELVSTALVTGCPA